MNLDLALAEAALVVHLLFILCVRGGVLLARVYPELQWAHIASLACSVFEAVPWPPCPTTVLEQELERRVGIAAYHGSFLPHYLDGLVYPNVSPGLLVAVSVAFCAANLAYYIFSCRNRKFMHRPPAR